MKIKLLLVFALITGLCLLGCEGPAGVNGTNGDDGANGSNSTEQGDKGDKGDKGDQGQKGPDGDPYEGDSAAVNGNDGPKGFDGASVIIMGAVDDESGLPEGGGGVTQEITEAWIVGGILYVWDRTNEDWINTNQTVRGIAGEQGQKGPVGEKGPVGGDPVTAFSIVFDPDNGVQPNTVVVVDGGKIITSIVPSKTLADFPIAAGGLYRANYTFTGWYETDGEGEMADEPFNFDNPFTKAVTLKAGWANPDLAPIGSSVTVTTNAAGAQTTYAVTEANFIQVVAAQIQNYGIGGAYILQLDRDITTTASTITVSQYAPVAGGTRQLSIVALPNDQDEEVERTITLNGNLTVTVANPGNSITLGKNVTIAGSATHDRALVVVQTSSVFIMEDGSKITGNTNTSATNFNQSFSYSNVMYSTAGVYVNGGTFIMKPGSEISNMTMSNINNSVAGIAVYVSQGASATYPDSVFIMEGGEIKDCTGDGLANVYIVENTFGSTAAALTLSGEAKPGSIALGITDTVLNRPITIAEGWTGDIDALDLRAFRTAIFTQGSRGDVMELWYNDATPASSPVIFMGDVSRITPDKLRNFVGTTVGVKDPISGEYDSSVALPFRDMFELDGDTGKLKIYTPGP